ncbi:MAG: TetR/AcrR family transcriptional regulator [Oligoflexus sp.]
MTKKTKPQPKNRKPLSKEQLFRTAVLLADKEGVAALSMRKIAKKLGVEAMSLYHHVKNKDEILDGMVDFVFSEIDLPSSKANWKAAMHQRALSTREALSRHPWSIGLMDSRANPGPATLRHHDSVIGCLRRAGFSIAMTAHAFSLLDSYIYGFVLQELSLPLNQAEDIPELAESIIQQTSADEYPYLTELAVEHTMKSAYSFTSEFEFGLEMILEGLERRRNTD